MAFESIWHQIVIRRHGTAIWTSAAPPSLRFSRRNAKNAREQKLKRAGSTPVSVLFCSSPVTFCSVPPRKTEQRADSNERKLLFRVPTAGHAVWLSSFTCRTCKWLCWCSYVLRLPYVQSNTCLHMRMRGGECQFRGVGQNDQVAGVSHPGREGQKHSCVWSCGMMYDNDNAWHDIAVSSLRFLSMAVYPLRC